MITAWMTTVRRSIVIVLTTIVLFSLTLPVLAEPLTPEAAAYQINQSDNAVEAGERLKQQANNYKQELREDSNYYTKTAAKNAAEDSKNKLEEIKETVVEKLNLNEPLPESTKEFLDDVQGKVDETAEPVVQGRPGYFKSERSR